MKSMLALLFAMLTASAFAADLKIYRDNDSGISIGFPEDWSVETTSKHRNTVFVASTKTVKPFGTCNVVVKPSPELATKSAAEIQLALSKPWSLRDWNAAHAGRYEGSLELVESKPVRVDSRPGQFGVITYTNEHFGRKTYWKTAKIVALAPGVSWNVMCGAASDSPVGLAVGFSLLEDTFVAIISSIRFAR